MKGFDFTHVNGNWFEFYYLDQYHGTAKIFSTGSNYGIGGGRISKLQIDSKTDGQVFNFDRSRDFDYLPVGIFSLLLEFLIKSHDDYLQMHLKPGDQ